MQRKDRAKRKRGADSLIDNYKKPIRLLHRQLLLIGLLAEDVVDHRVQADVLRNGVGDHAEVVDELVELFPFLAFREDWMEGPVVAPGQGLHHGNGDSGPLVDPMAGDLPNAVGMFCRRAATVPPRAFTDSVAVWAASRA